MADNKRDVKIAHGLKANAAEAVSSNKVDGDDFILFSDTDDELAFVSHNKEIKPIKSRTNIAYTLEGVTVGALKSGDVIPAGTSLDEFIEMICKKPPVVYPTYKEPTLSFEITSISEDITAGPVAAGKGITINILMHYIQNDGGLPERFTLKDANGNIIKQIQMFNNYNYTIGGTYTPINGINTIYLEYSYGDGDIKEDSEGNPYEIGAIKAGTKQLQVVSFEAESLAEAKYGFSTEAKVLNIEDLTNTESGISKKSEVSVAIPIGTKTIAFAYPEEFGEITEIEYVNLGDKDMAQNFDSHIDNSYIVYCYSFARAINSKATFKFTV